MVWGRIWGTQVRLVEVLASQRESDSVPIDRAITLFERHVQERRESSLEGAEFLKTQEQKNSYLAEWLGFLEGAQLIELEDGRVKKTQLTEEFVQYMQAERYTRQMRIW